MIELLVAAGVPTLHWTLEGAFTNGARLSGITYTDLMIARELLGPHSDALEQVVVEWSQKPSG
ncbi:MAG: hypothetical protein ACHQUB_01530 [Candidatus Saccharimonadia bacterium]